MNFTEFVSQKQVFTTQELLTVTGHNESSRVALSRAVKTGKVEKVRSGLYVSRLGRYQGTQADPHRIAATLRPDAVFAFHSAIELHGLSHSVSNAVQFMTGTRLPDFTFKGTTYKSIPLRQSALTQTIRARAYGSVVATTREQTLVDCLSKVSAAGGTEEVLRSFSSLPYADIDAILLGLNDYPSSVASRVGWYLEANQERWSVSKDVLRALEARIPSRVSYKLDPTLKSFESYCARWKLNLPVDSETLRSWMEM